MTRSDAFIWLEVGLVLLEEHDILSTGQVKMKGKVRVGSDLDLTC